MSRTSFVSFLMVAAVAVASTACGDNDEYVDPSRVDAATPDAAVPDAEQPDAFFCAPQADGLVGGGCAADGDCDQDGSDGVCLVGASGPVRYAPEGFCTIDDLNTGTVCAIDADCGAGGLCVDSDGYKFCLPACGCPGNTCPANQACHDSFVGFPLDKMACVPGNAAAVDGDACDGEYECVPDTFCRNNPLEFPGGQCYTPACTVGNNSTCNGGVCVMINDHPFNASICVDDCTSNADCRTSEGYVCFDPDGAGGSATNYCRHPQVGDTCAVDTDCGVASVWDCKTGGAFPGGYCTATACPTPGSAQGCSPNSTCFDDGAAENYCVDRCAGIGTQSTCRTGYTCADTDPGAGTFGGCVPTP